MSNPDVDRYHCYECGSPEVAYASLFPRQPILVGDSVDAKGETIYLANGMPHPGSQRLPGTKSNWDYNVCTPCYLKQRKEVYPEDDFTLGEIKLRMNAEIRRLKAEYQEAQQVEWAKAILARQQAKET